MSLLSIPPEIFDMIMSLLEDDEDTRRALIRLHTVFLHRFKLLHYKHLTLDGYAISGRRLIATLEGIRAEYISMITYSPKYLPVSPGVLKVLGNLHRFPNLTQVNIIFDWGYNLHIYPDLEDEICSMMKSSINAISKSRGSFSDFNLRIYPPPISRVYEIFVTNPFTELLRGVKKFGLEIIGATFQVSQDPLTDLDVHNWGLESSDEDVISMTEDHREFIELIPHIFLSRMRNLETLRISGCRSAFIPARAIDWRDVKAPRRLNSITIENTIIGETLAMFLLRNSAQSLRNINLRHCIASSDLWVALFEDLYKDRHGRLSITPMPIEDALDVLLARWTGRGEKAGEEADKAQEKLSDEIGDGEEMMNDDWRAELFDLEQHPLDGTPLFSHVEYNQPEYEDIESKADWAWKKWEDFLERMESNRLAL